MISKFIFKKLGWKENGPFPDLNKVVVIRSELILVAIL